jgi:hypothetical protein
VYRTKNSHPLFGYTLWWKGHGIGQQYLITSHLYLFNEAPDEDFSETFAVRLTLGSD